jgi:DNA-binding LacI/PurR family transcriptional regulator
MHFFSSAISGIQEYAAQHHYSTMICQSIESFEVEKSNIQMLVSNRVDGLLISLSGKTKEYDHIYRLIEKKIPVVMFDRIADNLPVSKVIVDDYHGAFKAVEYLIQTGCQNIAFLGGPENLSICRERLRGYSDALVASGNTVNENFVIHCNDLDPITAMNHLLDLPQRPDAIFCLNDPMAIKAMTVLKEKKVKIPDEISIVGFSNEPVTQYIEPSITTVSQPAYDMGKMAAKLFLEQVNSEKFEPVTVTLPTQLIVRNSTRKIKA